MKLADWRSDPVIPADWLRGYLALHPIYTEHRPTGGPIIDGTQIGQRQVYRLEAMMRATDEDGRRVGFRRQRLTFFLNGEVEIKEEC